MTGHDAWLRRVRMDLHLAGRDLLGVPDPATGTADACPSPACVLAAHSPQYNHHDGTGYYAASEHHP